MENNIRLSDNPNGKGSGRRKYSKVSEDAYRSNKLWENLANDKLQKDRKKGK